MTSVAPTAAQVSPLKPMLQVSQSHELALKSLQLGLDVHLTQVPLSSRQPAAQAVHTQLVPALL